MLHRIRIMSESDNLFQESWELYINSFPEDERRSKDYHIETLDKTSFHFDVILDNEQWIGFIAWWDFDNIRYIEHLATSTNLRNHGYGKKILEQFINEGNTIIILEVERPILPINIRRIDFYKRAGFIMNNHDYAQPPYIKDSHEFVRLLIMTHPTSISDDLMYEFKSKYLPQVHFRYNEKTV